jgi:hypothetical protein
MPNYNLAKFSLEIKKRSFDPVTYVRPLEAEFVFMVGFWQNHQRQGGFSI